MEPAHRVTRASVVAPADAPEVIAVGAIAGLRVRHRSRRVVLEAAVPTNADVEKPDVIAPDLVENYIYGYFGGTSCAAPHVAGAAPCCSRTIRRARRRPARGAARARRADGRARTATAAVAFCSRTRTTPRRARCLSRTTRARSPPVRSRCSRRPLATERRALRLQPRWPRLLAAERATRLRRSRPRAEHAGTATASRDGRSPWANATLPTPDESRACAWIEPPATIAVSARGERWVDVHDRGRALLARGGGLGHPLAARRTGSSPLSVAQDARVPRDRFCAPTSACCSPHSRAIVPAT
jgi:hypothetical protein